MASTNRARSQGAAPANRAAIGRQMMPATERAAQFEKVRDLLAGYSDRLHTLLPRALTPQRMLQLVFQELARTPRLIECTRNSLIGCVLQMAQLGLEPGGVLGEAYLLPRNNRKKQVTEATLIVGYRGLMKLARQSGEIVLIEAHAVHKRDEFRMRYGTNPELYFVPADSGELDAAGNPVGEGRGPLIGAFALATLRGSSERPFEYFDRAKIEHARRSSPAASDGPWITHYDEMSCKTVVRHFCKFLPADVKLQAAVSLDEKADQGLPQDLDSAWDLPQDAEGNAPADGSAPAEASTPAAGAAPAENAQPAQAQLPEGQAPVELVLEGREREPVPVQRQGSGTA